MEREREKGAGGSGLDDDVAVLDMNGKSLGNIAAFCQRPPSSIARNRFWRRLAPRRKCAAGGRSARVEQAPRRVAAMAECMPVGQPGGLAAGPQSANTPAKRELAEATLEEPLDPRGKLPWPRNRKCHRGRLQHQPARISGRHGSRRHRRDHRRRAAAVAGRRRHSCRACAGRRRRRARSTEGTAIPEIPRQERQARWCSAKSRWWPRRRKACSTTTPRRSINSSSATTGKCPTRPRIPTPGRSPSTARSTRRSRSRSAS